MAVAALKRSEGLMGAAIVGSVLVICIVIAVVFASGNTGVLLKNFGANEKYPAKAFVIKRQGSLKSKTTYTGIAAGNGLSVDVKFDKSNQELNLRIKDAKGKPMPRVTIDARASKVDRSQNSKRFAMKEHVAGEYRSDPIGLKKGGWILTLSAYDLYNRGNNKLLFHTEQPVFLK